MALDIQIEIKSIITTKLDKKKMLRVTLLMFKRINKTILLLKV